jgi:hypothetical protein
MSELAAGVIGGAVGGTLGFLGAAVNAYWGPQRLERWREDRRDEPRRQLLRRMLEDEERTSRTLRRLCVVTGTTEEECRRLLIQVGARGLILKDGEEGWALIARKPLDGSYTSEPSGATPEPSLAVQ